MAFYNKVHTFTGTNPAGPAVAVVGDVANGLLQYERFTVDADLIGATGGTLDVVLQRKIEGVDVWLDWLHYLQLAAADPAIRYSTQAHQDAAIRPVALSTTVTPAAPVLAANTFVGGHPGDKVRMVIDAGAGALADATLTVRLTCWRPRR